MEEKKTVEKLDAIRDLIIDTLEKQVRILNSYSDIVRINFEAEARTAGGKIYMSIEDTSSLRDHAEAVFRATETLEKLKR